MEVESNVREHKQMVDSPPFQKGIDAALLQCLALWGSQVVDGNTAMAVGFKVQGALEYLANLKLLAETPLRVMPAVVPTLSGNSPSRQ